MALFTLELDDEARARLELLRGKLGARSWAETLRRLIMSSPIVSDADLEDMAEASPEAGTAVPVRPSPPASQRVVDGARLPGVKPLESGFDAEDLRDTLAGRPPVGTRKKLTRRHAGKTTEEWFERLVRYDGDKPVWERET